MNRNFALLVGTLLCVSNAISATLNCTGKKNNEDLTVDVNSQYVKVQKPKSNNATTYGNSPIEDRWTYATVLSYGPNVFDITYDINFWGNNKISKNGFIGVNLQIKKAGFTYNSQTPPNKDTSRIENQNISSNIQPYSEATYFNQLLVTQGDEITIPFKGGYTFVCSYQN